jgi:hypothetical protein
VRLREPDRDLKREFLSTRLEAELSAAVRVRERPLVSEPADPREPDRDLKSVLLSVSPEAEPIDALKNKVRPLSIEPA